jgi:hypothetical protein
MIYSTPEDPMVVEDIETPDPEGEPAAVVPVEQGDADPDHQADDEYTYESACVYCRLFLLLPFS